MTPEEAQKILSDTSVVLMSHLASVRKEAVKVDQYSRGDRLQMSKAMEHIRSKLDSLAKTGDLSQLQMVAVLDLYNDVLGYIRGLSTSKSMGPLESARQMAKVRDLSDLRYTNVSILYRQEQEAKSNTVPDYFMESREV